MENNLIPQPTDPQVLIDREKNGKIVEAYYKVEGARNIEERLEFFTDDIWYEIMFTMDCIPDWICGKEKLRHYFKEQSKIWDEFKYSQVKISGTEDPAIFLVDCYGDGTMVNPMWRQPRPYHNYYQMVVWVRDGKIFKFRILSNPMKLMHDFWKVLPDYIE